MDPLTLAIVAGSAGLVKAGVGAYQAHKGAKMARENVRPEYQTPEEVHQQLALAKQMAGEDLPGRELLENQVNQGAAQSLSFAKDAGGGSAGLMAAAAGLNQNVNDVQTNIALKAAEFRNRNKENLGTALMTMGKFKDHEWMMNKFNPFQEKAVAAASMKGAGMQNMMGAVDDLAKVGTSMYMNQSNNAQLDSMLKNYSSGGGNATGSANGISPQQMAQIQAILNNRNLNIGDNIYD